MTEDSIDLDVLSQDALELLILLLRLPEPTRGKVISISHDYIKLVLDTSSNDLDLH